MLRQRTLRKIIDCCVSLYSFVAFSCCVNAEKVKSWRCDSVTVTEKAWRSGCDHQILTRALCALNGFETRVCSFKALLPCVHAAYTRACTYACAYFFIHFCSFVSLMTAHLLLLFVHKRKGVYQNSHASSDFRISWRHKLMFCETQTS